MAQQSDRENTSILAFSYVCGFHITAPRVLCVSASRYQCPDNAFILSTRATVSSQKAARMKRNRTRGLVGKKGRIQRLAALENVSRNTVSVVAG